MNSIIEENDSLSKKRNSNLFILYKNKLKINEYKASETNFKDVLKDKKLETQLKKVLNE